MIRLLLIMVSFMSIIHIACQSSTDKQHPTIKHNSNDSLLVEQSRISFVEGGLLQKMNKISGNTDTIFISVHRPDSADIILESPTDTANIRISQLFSPDGTADGPFGKELKYRFKDTGQYYITVNENLMVGNPYNGAYQVKIISASSH